MRAGEAAALRVEDLGDPGRITVYRRKTNSTDQRVMTADLLAALADYLPYLREKGHLLPQRSQE